MGRTSARQIPWRLVPLLILLPATAPAAEPFHAFEPGGEPGTSPRFQAWHPEFEDSGSYGESWFFLVRTDEGGVLFALLSITNLGLRTFDGTYELDYYAPDGSKLNVHREFTRDQVTASAEKMDVTIASARAWGGGNRYHLTMEDVDARLKLDITNLLQPYKFGDGSIAFYEDRRETWTLGIHTPCGRSSGTLVAGERTYNLDGFAYHDHAWANIKVPTFVAKWYTLRVLEQDLAIVLHQQVLTDTFGGATVRFGLVGMDGKIVASSRHFSLQPTAWRDVASGFKIPSAYRLLINANGCKIEGTIRETRFDAAIDVLGQVSWPIRMAIKAFYTNPYFHRYRGQYELDVTDRRGTVRHVSGTAVLEANYF